MQKLSYDPIPKESSKFISIGTPTYVHPNDKNNDELLANTQKDIEFLKVQFQKYYDRSSLDENIDKIKRNGPNTPQRNKLSISQNPHQLPNSASTPKRNTIADHQSRLASFIDNKKKNRSNSDNNNNLNFIYSEKIPEYLFIKQTYKTISKQKLIEYHKICCELSSVISRILNFTQIHYEQKIPISVDHQKFLEYCSSFFQQKQKENPYLEVSKKEEILENKLQQLSIYSKYKIISIDQLRRELIKHLNIENENDNQSGEKKMKIKVKKEKEIHNENSNDDDDNENNDAVKENIQSYYNSVLDYAPYSLIDDYLFYFVRSHRIGSLNNQFHDTPIIEIQKVALEITGITERNLSFKANDSKEDVNPNYTLFNVYLNQLFSLIFEDQSMFDIIKEKDKEKRKEVYQHQIKTIITIAFTRIIFDTAYLFNYDYLLNDQTDEKNHRYLHFNQEDEIIEINSQIIQRLLPSDLDIPDGFLIDYSMHKSHSHQDLQQSSNHDSDTDSFSNSNLPLSSSLNSNGSFCTFTPIKSSSKTIHELMAKEDDFLEMADKLSDLQFYSNPFDISYLIYQIFNKIQIRLSKISQMTSKKSKNVEKEGGITRSKSREFNPFVQFDDFFLFFLVVFTFNPPKNSRWIAAMLKRYSKLIPNMLMQQSASFFIAVVNYSTTFPSNEELSQELMDHINQIKEEISTHNSNSIE